jgi:hypothetical protein
MSARPYCLIIIDKLQLKLDVNATKLTTAEELLAETEAGNLCRASNAENVL